MALIAKAVRGTQDLLPEDSYKRQYVERTMKEVAENSGFAEIRTPVFEETGLFVRSVGDTTDVVQKEMYTFEDKGNRSLTLRPEGTAGVARAFLEHGLHNGVLPFKAYYIASCYRYEKPQAGRQREFHQFGIECFGAEKPSADAEIIAVGATIFERLQIKGLELNINSIGCTECRPHYLAILKEYYREHADEMCFTCTGRLETNPMRILDCKNPVCSELAKKAPSILDHICDECKEHFDEVKMHLKSMDIHFTINPQIVRGLDYYSRTVFEFISNDIGSQGTVLGGGRYDGLIEEIGGPHVPSLGFGIGLERLMLLMENQKTPVPDKKTCDIYLGAIGEVATNRATKTTNDLRREGFFAEADIVGRSVKAQMRYANKIGAKYTLVLGEREIENGKVSLRNMHSREDVEMSLDTFVQDFSTVFHTEALKELQNSLDMSENLDISKLMGGLK